MRTAAVSTVSASANRPLGDQETAEFNVGEEVVLVDLDGLAQRFYSGVRPLLTGVEPALGSPQRRTLPVVCT